MLLPPTSSDGAFYLDAYLLTCLFDGAGLLVNSCSSTLRGVTDADADLLALKRIGLLIDLYTRSGCLRLVAKGQSTSVNLLQILPQSPQHIPQIVVVALKEFGP